MKATLLASSRVGYPVSEIYHKPAQDLQNSTAALHQMPVLWLLAQPLVQREFISVMLMAELVWFWPIYSFTCELYLRTVHYRTQTTGCVCTRRSDACHVMASAVVTICTANLTFTNSTFCPHIVLMCFVWIWDKQRSLISVDICLYICGGYWHWSLPCQYHSTIAPVSPLPVSLLYCSCLSPASITPLLLLPLPCQYYSTIAPVFSPCLWVSLLFSDVSTNRNSSIFKVNTARPWRCPFRTAGPKTRRHIQQHRCENLLLTARRRHSCWMTPIVQTLNSLSRDA